MVQLEKVPKHVKQSVSLLNTAYAPDCDQDSVQQWPINS
jgi:hypothetical protein